MVRRGDRHGLGQPGNSVYWRKLPARSPMNSSASRTIAGSCIFRTGWSRARCRSSQSRSPGGGGRSLSRTRACATRPHAGDPGQVVASLDGQRHLAVGCSEVDECRSAGESRDPGRPSSSPLRTLSLLGYPCALSHLRPKLVWLSCLSWTVTPVRRHVLSPTQRGTLRFPR